MWRKIRIVFLAALVLSMMMVGNIAQTLSLKLSVLECVYSVMILWVLLIARIGWMPIIIIVVSHFMKINHFKILLSDRLMSGDTTVVELQRRCKEKWKKDLSLDDALQAMYWAKRSEWITFEGELEIDTILRLTPLGISAIQDCRREGVEGLERLK